MRLSVKKEDKDSDIPEEEIIRRTQEGNAGAFEQLYRRYSRRVYSLCLRMVKNDSEAEDLGTPPRRPGNHIDWSRRAMARRTYRVCRPRLLGGHEIAGFCINGKGREPFGWPHLDLDLSPRAIVLRVTWFVSQNILVSQLHPDLCDYIRQFVNVPNREGSPASHLGHFGKQRWPSELLARSGANVDWIVDTDCVKLAVGLFQEVLYVVLIVPTMVVSPV